MLPGKRYCALLLPAPLNTPRQRFSLLAHPSDCSWSHTESLQSLLTFPLAQPSREKDKEKK